jgi:hypothetical protein
MTDARPFRHGVSGINNKLTIGGKLPYGVSDEMLSFFEATTIMVFNKQKMVDLGLADLYGIVRKGEWTFDKLFEYAKEGIQNVSGGNIITAASVLP